ncbi:hypothetical protein MCUN1_000972 [Malassezia cuniculi]|uniref:Uncharacterized protein n=1 Tax=Malassezia cuniculi TaxID=948313 RepID=A0AAF0J548_9BASI|nr:hypothetical protein MCUN1_000972 [Malassezia cuniculi]
MKVPFVTIFLAALALLSVCVSAVPFEDTVNAFFGKRQAVGLGGGGGVATTSSICSTCIQSIKGYTAPTTSETRTPTNISSGSIISMKDIPGYSKAMDLTHNVNAASSFSTQYFVPLTTVFAVIIAAGAFAL